MEPPSTLYKKKKRVSLANKPGSKGDAGNNKPPTKQVTETACSPPEEIQQQEEAAIIVPPAVDPLPTAAQEVSPPSEAPSNPAKDPELVFTSARRRHMSFSSSSSLSSSSSSSSSSSFSSSSSSDNSSAPTTFSKSKDPLLEISEAITTRYTIDEVPAPTYTPTEKTKFH
nr:uncharacterized serine-rich protein C1E8.05-like [Crassostrea gigas]